MKKDDSDLTQTPKGTDATAVRKVIEQNEDLVGGVNFTQLTDELVKLSSVMAKTGNYEVFACRAFLFSIGDGCGLSTYLKFLADLIASLGLRKVNKIPVVEQRLGSYDDGPNAFKDFFMSISQGEQSEVSLMCVDISEWLEHTEDFMFKQFLKILEKLNEHFVIVFRVPFIDRDVLERIKISLSDLMFVKTVIFPPVSRGDIEKLVAKEVMKYGYSISSEAFDPFFARLASERADGNYYGLNTVRKVIKELVYNKMLRDAQKGTKSTAISVSDTRSLTVGNNNNADAKSELEMLIGLKEVKENIRAFVDDFKAYKRDAKNKKYFNLRFVGNPGTGRSRVAEILGKMLKEEGIISNGLTAEFRLSDLCGRYVGETAPKTAAVYRDAAQGVLFIDGLDLRDNEKYGKEALATLLSRMRNADNVVVVFADYDENMRELIKSFPEAEELIPYTINFANYDRKELSEIFASQVKEGFCHDDELFAAADRYFLSLPDEIINSREFSNARFVRNLYTRTWAKAVLRAEMDGKTQICLTKEDFECASKEKDVSFDMPKKIKMGFTIE